MIKWMENMMNDRVPSLLLPWLTWQQSLTNRLLDITGDAALEKIKHAWEKPDLWDKEVLRVSDDKVIHREIVMFSHHRACWFARSTIPKNTYDAAPWLFERLNHEPLGHLIFDSGQIKRVSLTHYPLVPSDVEWAWLPMQPVSDGEQGRVKRLWCRLSEFALIAGDQRFYLLEVLLPGLEFFL